MTDIAILGAAGRMGQRLVALARQEADLNIAAAIERPDHPAQARDAGEVAGIGAIGLPITSDMTCKAHVLVDFTTPAATRHWLKKCRDARMAMLIGTTGLQDSDHASIDQAAVEIPILQSPTMALGIAVLMRLAAQAATALGADCDIEIVESHHRFKKDAPSGTALAIADAILRAVGRGRESLVFDRHGAECPRKAGEIGMHALRLGDDVGRHTASFALLGERLEISHTATSRDTFVRGALRAARWLAQQKPGRYTLAHVLGL